MAWLPTAYKSDILVVFTTVGTTGVYNKATGQGIGLQWKQDVPKGKGAWVANVNYVVSGACSTALGATSTDTASCGNGKSGQAGSSSTYGVFNSNSGLNLMAQLGYKANNWGAAFGYRYGTAGTLMRDGNGPASNTLATNQYSNSIAFNAYWQPIQSGWFPSISAGYAYNFVSNMNGYSASSTSPTASTGALSSKSWMVGLQWDNAFVKANAAGVAFGQPSYATCPGGTSAQCQPFLVEWFYRIQATDNISITPTLFYGSSINNGGSASNASAYTGLGGVIQTTFKF